MSHSVKSLPKVAIIGRPNVGKSTLFNRLVGRRQAIVDDIPGVTRDRQYGRVKSKDIGFELIDTGGFIPGVSEDFLSRAVLEQVHLAHEEAEVILFTVDGRFGVTPAEEEIARWLHAKEKPVILCVNKIDQAQHEPLMADFWKLGFENTLALSAEAPRGISELLKTLQPLLTKVEAAEEKESDLRLAIVGQPNVGKSTLFNALVGEGRAVVHHEAGTTLDPLNTRIEHDEKIFEFVDTAGIKRRRSTVGKIEKVGVLKALESVRMAHLVLLLVDATRGFAAQDLKILGMAEEYGRAVLVVLNKWDLMPAGSRLQSLKGEFVSRFKRQEDIPLIALSAKTKRGVQKLFPMIDEVQKNFRRRIGTGELNRVFQKALQEHPPPTVSGKFLNLYYLTQSGHSPPRFVLFANHPELVPENYLRYLERVFRKHFAFTGVPLRWALKERRSGSTA
jgi:GTP-binding protein